MAKIGIDCRLWGTGNTGIGRYTQELVENLQKIDHENEYILFCRQKDFEKIDIADWKKIVADIPHYSFLEQTALVQIFLRENLDLLHTPHFNVPILYPKPYIITIHDILWHKSYGTHSYGTNVTNLSAPFYWGKYAAYRVAVKFAVKKARKIIVPSHAVEKDIVGFFPKAKNKICVTYEGVSDLAKGGVIKNKAPYILYVGNLYPHKNIEMLVRALACYHILERGNKLIIGCGRSIFLNKFQQFLGKEGVTDFVEVKSTVSDKELAGLYKNAQAFVFPTLSEGFGLPGLEAMSCETPVVCSDIPVLREIYGNAALYFNPRDPRDIAEKVQKVLEDKATRMNLVRAGGIQIKKYSWRKMAQQTLNVYKEVLGQ